MAFTPTNPTEGMIPQPDVAQDLDTFHILSVRFALTPGNAQKTILTMEWTEGYMDDTVYVPVKTFKESWNGELDSDLVDAINTITSGGSLYNEMKNTLWAFLQTKGKIGAGTIS